MLVSGILGYETHLLCLPGRHCGPDLGQTFADKQDPIDEHPISRTVDLEVPEQDIGAE